MKKIYFFFIVILINLLTSNLLAQNKSDTIFLLKEKVNSDIHNIFIDPNNNSLNYNILRDFSSFPKKLTKKSKSLEITSKWVPLYQYQSNYYLYRPCDLGNSSRICLSNNKIAFEGFEIYTFNIDSKIKKINDSSFKLTYNDHQKDIIELEIHIVDKEKGVAVFKYIKNKNDISYQLMADFNKLKQFKIIVNECRFSKTNEFEFDKIDFQKMMIE